MPNHAILAAPMLVTGGPEPASTIAVEPVTSLVQVNLRGPKHTPSPEDRVDAGNGSRDKVAREGRRNRPDDQPNPIEILRVGDPDRLPEVVPIRYGRMLQSPFTFYRGSPGVMTSDLAALPDTGLHVQLCDDCHLMEFGRFAASSAVPTTSTKRSAVSQSLMRTRQNVTTPR